MVAGALAFAGMTEGVDQIHHRIFLLVFNRQVRKGPLTRRGPASLSGFHFIDEFIDFTLQQNGLLGQLACC